MFIGNCIFIQFIRDITDNFKSDLFEKVLDEHIPSKIFKTITNQILSKQSSQQIKNLRKFNIIILR